MPVMNEQMLPFFGETVFFSSDYQGFFFTCVLHVTLKHQKLCELVRAPQNAHFFI